MSVALAAVAQTGVGLGAAEAVGRAGDRPETADLVNRCTNSAADAMRAAEEDVRHEVAA